MCLFYSLLYIIKGLYRMDELKLKWIAGGFAALGISFLIYKIYTRKFPPQQPPIKRKQSHESHDENRLRTINSNYSQFYFDKEQQLKKLISKISPSGPTIQQIYLLSPLIIVDQYIKYTRQIRRRRRLIRKINEEQYINLIRCYEIELKELLCRGREEVSDQYGFSLQDLEKMENAYEMFDNIQELKKRATNELKTMAFSHEKCRKIPKDKLKKILEEQIVFISNKTYDRLKLKMQDDQTGITQEDSFKIITTLCDDIVYQKYGYQRQQIQKHLEQLPLLAKDLKRHRQTLFAHIVQCEINTFDSQQQDQDQNEDTQQKIEINSSKAGTLDHSHQRHPNTH